MDRHSHCQNGLSTQAVRYTSLSTKMMRMRVHYKILVKTIRGQDKCPLWYIYINSQSPVTRRVFIQLLMIKVQQSSKYRDTDRYNPE